MLSAAVARGLPLQRGCAHIASERCARGSGIIKPELQHAIRFAANRSPQTQIQTRSDRVNGAFFKAVNDLY